MTIDKSKQYKTIQCAGGAYIVVDTMTKDKDNDNEHTEVCACYGNTPRTKINAKRIAKLLNRDVVADMIKDRIDSFTEEWQPDKVLVFCFDSISLVVHAPKNYKRLVVCSPLGRHDMKMVLEYDHDSCWTEGVESFVNKTLYDLYKISDKGFKFSKVYELPISEIDADVWEAFTRKLGYYNKEVREIRVKGEENFFKRF